MLYYNLIRETLRSYQNYDMIVRRSAEIRTCNSRIGTQESLEVIIAALLTVSIQVCTLLAMCSLYAQCLQIVQMSSGAHPAAYSMGIRLLSLL